MKFIDVQKILSSIMTDLGDGYSPLELPEPLVASMIQEDPGFVAMADWLLTSGLTINNLTVMSSNGEVKLTPPGIWLQEGEPVVLFGFKDGTPCVASIDPLALVLIDPKKRLYSAIYKEETLPLTLRLNTDSEDCPQMLTRSKAREVAKELKTGGGSADWLRFRDVVPVDGSITLQVKSCEVKKMTSKAGKPFTVYLMETNNGLFSINEKQFGYIQSLITYNNLSETGTQIEVTHNGYYNEYMTFKLKSI
jgi:hypothetical protein